MDRREHRTTLQDLMELLLFRRLAMYWAGEVEGYVRIRKVHRRTEGSHEGRRDVAKGLHDLSALLTQAAGHYCDRGLALHRNV